MKVKIFKDILNITFPDRIMEERLLNNFLDKKDIKIIKVKEIVRRVSSLAAAYRKESFYYDDIIPEVEEW